MNEYFERDIKSEVEADFELVHNTFCFEFLLTCFWICQELSFYNIKLKLALTLLSPTVTVHWIPLCQKRAVRVHLIDFLIAWGYQGGNFAPFDSLGLLECVLFALRQPGAARVHIKDPVAAGAGRVEILPSLPAFGYSTKLCHLDTGHRYQYI